MTVMLFLVKKKSLVKRKYVPLSDTLWNCIRPDTQLQKKDVKIGKFTQLQDILYTGPQN
jgi:hypothetical protein